LSPQLKHASSSNPAPDVDPAVDVGTAAPTLGVHSEVQFTTAQVVNADMLATSCCVVFEASQPVAQLASAPQPSVQDSNSEQPAESSHALASVGQALSPQAKHASRSKPLAPAEPGSTQSFLALHTSP
jgi:hypothetical protein